MNSIFNLIERIRRYEFLDITKSVNEAQVAVCKQPNGTWGQFGNKLYDICWYNTESIMTVFADVTAYLTVSGFRKVGFFLPLPPEPPVFPNPQDNVEFLHNAIERALWNWHPALSKEMHQGIEEGLSDTWNVFQVVGEWALAYAFEHAKKGECYKPTFLKISEGLAGGETFATVGLAFSKLWQKEKDKILNAIYRQEEMPTLGDSGKKVYQDIRALASKLQQGNTIYFEAFGNYQKQKAAGTLRKVESIANKVVTVQPPEPKMQQVFDASVQPSAPVRHIPTEEEKTRSDIEFFRQAILNATDSRNRESVIQAIRKDRNPPLAIGNHPETLAASQPDDSWKLFVAKLSILRGFQEVFQKNCSDNTPYFIPWNESLQNCKTVREIGPSFAKLNDREFSFLEQAILNPSKANLSESLRQKLLELSECADILQRKPGFLKIYQEF